MAKLQIVHNASVLSDCALPPGNRLEALSGDRRGQHSIRVNDQWPVCFRWHEGNAFDVTMEDYHQVTWKTLRATTIMNTVQKLTPGEMIKHFLDDMGVTQYQLAKSTRLPHSRITELVKGRRGITADTALRLAGAFGNSAEFWMNLQKDHELDVARREHGRQIEADVARLQPAAS